MIFLLVRIFRKISSFQLNFETKNSIEIFFVICYELICSQTLFPSLMRGSAPRISFFTVLLQAWRILMAVHPAWKWNIYATYTTFGNENMFWRHLNTYFGKYIYKIYVKYILNIQLLEKIYFIHSDIYLTIYIFCMFFHVGRHPRDLAVQVCWSECEEILCQSSTFCELYEEQFYGKH